MSSVKSLSIRKETKVNLTKKILNGKMLMFSKTSIQSFVNDLIDVFMFLHDDIKQICGEYKIQKCFCIKI